MSRTLSLTAVAACVLDSSGNGTASTGPAGTRESWQPATAAVSVSTNVKEATARIYTGAQVFQGTFTDGTTWGSTGDSTSNFTGTVYPGQQVWAVWTGGDPGATATLVVSGTRTVP